MADSSGGNFWGSIFSAALPSLISLGGGIFQNQANQAAVKDQRAYDEKLRQQKLDDAIALKLAGGAGGGGGGGGPFTGFTDPQKVQALQEQSNSEIALINNMIKAYQNAVLPR